MRETTGTFPQSELWDGCRATSGVLSETCDDSTAQEMNDEVNISVLAFKKH